MGGKNDTPLVLGDLDRRFHDCVVIELQSLFGFKTRELEKLIDIVNEHPEYLQQCKITFHQ